jgi:MYXO-CTERM domain-containing protein
MGQGEFIFPGGLGSQTSLSSRWGDYSSLSVDPVDDCTFWYSNQYIPFDGAYNWRSRLMTFALPGCATANDFAAWMAPARQTVRRGGTATMSLSTAALHGTALAKTLQLAVTQPRAGVSAAPPAPLALLPGQAATVTIAADANADLGEAPFTVQASAATGTVSAEATAVVIDSDFAVAVDKPNIAVGAGGTTEILINTAPVFGAPEVVLFSAPHVPRGISVTFDPPFVRVGDSAKLRLRGERIDLAGAGTVRVVASGNLVSHSATIHLRSLVLPTVRIILPLTHTSVRGNISVSASAIPSPGTTVAAMDLLIDGSAVQGFPAPPDERPAELTWRTSTVDDGPHYMSVRATDVDGNQGLSDLVLIWVQNKNECGCSSDGGGWEALALAALLASIRRRRKA